MGNQKHISMQNKWREKIKGSNVLTRLIQVAEGTLEIDKTAAMVSLRLIDKILPNLQAVTVEQTVNHVGLTKWDLDARLIALGENPEDVWNTLANHQVVGHKVGGVLEHDAKPLNDMNGDDHQADKLPVDKLLTSCEQPVNEKRSED